MQIKLASWNVNGIRSAIKKNFWQITANLGLDVLCLQEIKADAATMHHLGTLLDYRPYLLQAHTATNRSGYSGVATFSLAKPAESGSVYWSSHGLSFAQKVVSPVDYKLILTNFQLGLGIAQFDVEGRVVITEYQTTSGDSFTLINAYYPQGGRGQFRIDYKLEFYAAVFETTQNLRHRGQNVILCGDFNTTVSDIDLARPKENRQTTGCLPEERQALDRFLQAGFIDSFRYFHPTVTDKYTYWDPITRARERNVGWRIDYFLVDVKLLDKLRASTIHDDIFGSDHCPVSIVLEF